MDKRLAQLISDYQKAVGAAVVLMTESGLKTPSSNAEWLDLKIPEHGYLKGGVRYYKHGFGCWVHLPEGKVDFDFGRNGQIDGFDEWRLWNFCQDSTRKYGFETLQAISDCIRHAVEEGTIVASSYILYYVVDSVNLLGQEVARILAVGCALPHRDQDSIQLLSSQCFESADLMFEHYKVINLMWEKKGRLGGTNGVKFRIYLLSWLGYLNETAEGFRKMNMRLLLEHKRPTNFAELIPELNKVGSLRKKYDDDLRKLRNDTFHLRASDESITRFFADDGERMKWATELHAAFASFFSNYRVLAEVEYLHLGRFGESQIRKEGTERRKMRRGNATAKLQAK